MASKRTTGQEVKLLTQGLIDQYVLNTEIDARNIVITEGLSP